MHDNVPAHHARKTVALLSAETTDFIGPQYWPRNSPDPVDYTIWNILQERVYRCQPDRWRRPFERTTDLWIVPLWSANHWSE